jgi:hypothetical protein
MDVSGFENASFIASTVRLPAAPNEHQYVGGVVVFKTDLNHIHFVSLVNIKGPIYGLTCMLHLSMM